MQQALVASRLDAEAGVAAFCRFVQQARHLSQRHGVAGALLFDGETSLHLVEGADSAVRDFMGALYSGGPQQDIRVVASRCGQAGGLAPRWCAGYVEPQSLETWCTLPDGADAAAAIQGFLALVAEVDCV